MDDLCTPSALLVYGISELLNLLLKYIYIARLWLVIAGRVSIHFMGGVSLTFTPCCLEVLLLCDWSHLSF